MNSDKPTQRLNAWPTSISVAIVVTFSVSTALAWSGPTQTAPAGNTPTPFNVGTTSQVKAGGIWAQAIGSDSGYCIGGSCIVEWPNPATSTFIGGLTVLGNATSTFSNGINLTDGCFSINGVCIGTNLFTTLSVTGGNNVNPQYPDGLVGTPVTRALPGSYTVPAGKTLYVTYWSPSNYLKIDGINIISSGWQTNTAAFHMGPIIVGAGSVVSSIGTGMFNGLLVNTGVTPITQTVGCSPNPCSPPYNNITYTVPAGKNLYIMTSSPTQKLRIDGMSLGGGVESVGNDFLIIGAGSVISVDQETKNYYYANFNGYLTNANGLGGP